MSLSSIRKSFANATHRAVVVTEVTRMQQGMVCVAALDLATGDMVRPLQSDGSNWEEDKWVPDHLAVGNVLNLEPTGQPTGTVFPHASEDYRVTRIRKLGAIPTADLFALCDETADASVEAIFGALHAEKYVVAGTHVRSLGCVMVDAASIRLSDMFDKMQLSWRDGEGIWHNVPVTELAAKSAGDASDGIADIRSRLDAGHDRVALRLGLARAWSNDGEFDPSRCYLQLNGIVLPG